MSGFLDMNKDCCQEILGWKVVKTYDINIPKSKVLELEHIETGAKYIHIANDSQENVFVVGFQTVPTDSSGVAHILEHIALTGSQNYPIRDPFFAMLRRSLQSFMNAFTSEDWTAYPFASPNKKDFYNLMNLYLDAAFFPKLEKLNFMQEGWRYTMTDDGLQYDGVVFNEMKGSMSSESSCMAEAVGSSLYKEAPYHFNTGGDPEEIPGLSHEQLVAFHKKHYHPSNAFFFTYGNLQLMDHLKLVNERVMKDFGRLDDLPAIKKETRWTGEREVRVVYPVAKDQGAKSQVALSWLCASVKDNIEVFSLEMLEDVLLGSEAAPLLKVLLDSGLGEDLCDDSGYEAEPLDTRFTIGLKGVIEQDKEKVKALILDTLEKLSKKGIDRELIESVINNTELRKRNIQNQPYPYGLRMYLNIMAPWMHGGDVGEVLEFDELLRELRERIKDGSYFEGLIKKYLLDNPHRLFLTLAPDENLSEKKEAEEKSRLKKIENKFSEEDKKEIVDNNQRLQKLQSEEMDLTCLPSLDLEDIDSSLPKEKAEKINNLYKYKKQSNGLAHVLSSFDLSTLAPENLSLLPLYTYLLSKMNTSKRDYEELNKKIDSISSGVSTSLSSISRSSKSDYLPALMLQSYCLLDNTKKMHDLICEVLAETRFDDENRIKMLLSNLYSKYKSSIVGSGHEYASRLALSTLSQQASVSETWHGLSQIEFLEKLKNFDTNLKQQLSELQKYITEKSSIDTAIIAEDTSVAEHFADMAKSMNGQNKNVFEAHNTKKAFATSTSVSFTAVALSLPGIEDPDSPALLALAKILARGYIHHEIREKGGAYGGFARYNHLDGSWWFGTYRDPHILRSLEVIAGAKAFIDKKDFSQSEIEEAIIAVSSDINSPKTEVEQAKTAFMRTLAGLSDETREEFRARLLRLKAEDIKNVAHKYLKDDWQDYSVAVISNLNLINKTNSKLKSGAFEVQNI